jgi:hypothetical protein
VSWRKAVALAVPVAVLMFALGFFVGLEVRRGPNWRLELEEYIAQHRAPSETVVVQAVVRARQPQQFGEVMGTVMRADGVRPSSTPRDLRCVLLLRNRPSDSRAEYELVRQVVFLAYYSDALYQLGWLAHEGPEEPFSSEFLAHLALIGCDLGLR